MHCALGSAVDHSRSREYVDSVHRRLRSGVHQQTGAVVPDISMDCTARPCGDACVLVNCMGECTKVKLAADPQTRSTDYCVYML